MSRQSSPTTRQAYRYTIGGEAYGMPHLPGDEVPDNVPQRKIAEWHAAGVITPANPAKKEQTNESQRSDPRE